MEGVRESEIEKGKRSQETTTMIKIYKKNIPSGVV